MPEYGKAYETIAQYLAAGDRTAASRTAHSVKGAAAVIGATGLSQVAAELEQVINDSGADIDDLLSLFRTALENILEAVDGFLDVEVESEV